MTFYCEQASAFVADVGMDDEGFLDSLLGMFENALKIVLTLDPAARAPWLARLDDVRMCCHGFGYGIGDAMDDQWDW
jgi:hypothetical protein